MKPLFVLLAVSVLIASASAIAVPAQGGPTARDLRVPRYQHIFVIMEENKDYGQIIGSKDAPTITRLAREYGSATNFYAETHPSEPNYVALIGGYTFGIQDDDAYYCRPDDGRPSCTHSHRPSYVNHTVDAPNIGTQLQTVGLTWKNYNESLPAPGSLAVYATDPNAKGIPPGLVVYASKHSGFINFKSTQDDPQRAQHLVGFDQLRRDLASGNVPNFSFVVPNICDEMHGSSDADTPEDCSFSHFSRLVWRGDENIAKIVDEIKASPIWRSAQNVAIVVTFDEDDHYSKAGCCGTQSSDPANSGGGHIPTIVVTNHGPRGVADATPYSHYSLLRTIEDAFGIHTYLQRAAAPGVVPMLTLFR